MVYICSVNGCNSNYPGTNENVPVFEFPKDEDLSKRWQRFASGTNKNWKFKASSRVCRKHFEPIYLKKGSSNTRFRLVKTILNPLSTDSSVVLHMKNPIAIPRKSPI